MYKDLVSGRLLSADKTAVFANSALVNTQVNVDLTIDRTIIASPKPRCSLEVYNPSTVTDLTVKICTVEAAFGGDTRYCIIDTVTIPKSQTITGTTVNAYLKLVEGMFTGTDIRLIVSNNTALGAAEGFTAYVRIREV